MSSNPKYKTLFPYFGGKSSIANIIWQAIGNPANYVEPFFGSGAVLFMRPEVGGVETVNDADGMLCNLWRSIQMDPEGVARHADWPVNECDLHARHLWLIGQRESIADLLMGNPDYYDAKIAGWWLWGICCWIGSGWCSGAGSWRSVDGKFVKSDAKGGVNRQMPHLSNAGQGVQRKINHADSSVADLIRWFSDRLRRVRVCCGDWSRICGPSVTYGHGITGVFLDPPYADTANRSDGLYAVDSFSVAHDVREWAIEQGSNRLMRIVVAGYEGEHDFPDTWRMIEWKANGGYGSQGDGKGRANSTKERLWLSPHCLDVHSPRQMDLITDT